jgi:hypothetical protein
VRRSPTRFSLPDVVEHRPAQTTLYVLVCLRHLATLPKRSAWPKGIGSEAMSQFDPRLVNLVKYVAEDVMSKVPVEPPATKADFAECLLKAAAQGHTTYNELMSADWWCRPWL